MVPEPPLLMVPEPSVLRLTTLTTGGNLRHVPASAMSWVTAFIKALVVLSSQSLYRLADGIATPYDTGQG